MSIQMNYHGFETSTIEIPEANFDQFIDLITKNED